MEIYPEEKTPFKIEKMLEYFYTGNYTFRRRMPTMMSAEINGEERRRNDTTEVGTDRLSEG